MWGLTAWVVSSSAIKYTNRKEEMENEDGRESGSTSLSCKKEIGLEEEGGGGEENEKAESDVAVSQTVQRKPVFSELYYVSRPASYE